MKLYIKNMVCDRCKMAVTRELEKQKIRFTKVELGEIELTEAPSDTKLKNFRNGIEILGFELIDDKKSKLIGKIKAEIIKAIHQPAQRIKINFSSYLSEKSGKIILR